MNSGPLLFLGIFASLATSFWGLLLVPQLQLGRQDQATNSTTFALYPQPRSGAAKDGAEVYRSLGCVECHSQQVRGRGADIERHWGARITVAQDYVGDNPVLLGAQRIGPDLANVGLRSPARTNLLQRLYNPQQVVPGSMMPPYRFLFEWHKLKEGDRVSPDAVDFKVESGTSYERIPSGAGNTLVDYLTSLRADAPLYEAPMLTATGTASTNTAPGTNTISTNASAEAVTNQSAPVAAPSK